MWLPFFISARAAGRRYLLPNTPTRGQPAGCWLFSVIMLTVFDVLMIFSGPDFILQCVDNVSVHIFSVSIMRMFIPR